MWVELRCALERVHRFAVVERVNERKALIEEPLRFGAVCGDRMVQRAHAGKQSCGHIGRAVSAVLILRPRQ